VKEAAKEKDSSRKWTGEYVSAGTAKGLLNHRFLKRRKDSIGY